MRVTKKMLEKMSVLELCVQITEATAGCSAILPEGDGKPYIYELASRLQLSPLEALMLTVFVDQCYDARINYRDIARHFGVRITTILMNVHAIDSLQAKGIIVRRKNKDDISYRVNPKLVASLREGKLPVSVSRKDLKPFELMDIIFGFLDGMNNDEMDSSDFVISVRELMQNNMHLDICQKIESLGIGGGDLLFFLLTSMMFINRRDDHIIACDVDDYLSSSELRQHLADLADDSHELLKKNLIEHGCTDEGQVDARSWKLSDYAKKEVFAELKLDVKGTKNQPTGLKKHEDIVEKKLYYNENVTKQIETLQNLLADDKMKRVMDRLAAKGLRRGFPVLFYGAPGTGKTETVLQLSRISGRDIMQVDLANVRSKWVGETEQNVKAIFDKFRRLVKDSDKSPILLLNEADAILNKRKEGAENSVDKMENAMQNIILQELENLEGILIATTNLTQSLDKAFERRFLYKIEFEKPTPNERKHIWHAMLPELSDEESLQLATKYDLSGGQIENVARKQAIDSILRDEERVSLEAVESACKSESLYKKSTNRIGFAC